MTDLRERAPEDAARPVADRGSGAARCATPILEMRHIAKRFDATQALEDVSLALYPGEVHALLGENGAGKSTLIKIMTGVHQPDRGEILLDGQPVAIAQRRRGAAPRHRRDLPGAAAVPRPQRRREHLHQPPGPRRGRRLAADVPRGRGDPRRARRLARRAQPGARPDARRAAVGRDRQGDLAQRPRADHGRADRLAVGARGRAAVQAGARPARPGRRDPVRQPPHGGGVRDRRQGHGVPRRPADLDPAARRGRRRRRAIADMVGREMGLLQPRAAGAARRAAAVGARASAATASSRTSASISIAARCSASPG